jgi:antitoxin component of RelBE/YafQ-DinJ toxin-antitoxin module
MNITRIDSETLAIARLVAEAEGITLAEAIRDQVELFS